MAPIKICANCLAGIFQYRLAADFSEKSIFLILFATFVVWGMKVIVSSKVTPRIFKEDTPLIIPI